MPERIGHPDGLPDEKNYLKILLAPLGLYRPLPWFRRPELAQRRTGRAQPGTEILICRPHGSAAL